MIDTNPRIERIKSIDEMPATPEGFRLRFAAAVETPEQARGLARRKHAIIAWWLARGGRLYWFEAVRVNERTATMDQLRG